MAVNYFVSAALLAVVLSAGVAGTLGAQSESRATSVHIAGASDSVSIHLVDVDLRAAVQSLTRYLDRPVAFGSLAATRVTLETPSPVARVDVVRLLRGLLLSQNSELISDSGLYRVQTRVAPPVEQPIAPSSVANRGVLQLFSIRLHHARASDVAATVNALYGRASAIGELGSRPQTLDDALHNNKVVPGSLSSRSEGMVVSQTAEFSGDVTIVPDARSNGLLIRASQSDFELIRVAVDVLDIRPLQVLIKVTIAEVRRDRSFSLGNDASTGPVGVRGTSGQVTSSLSSQGVAGDIILKIMSLGGVRLDAALSAGVANGDVRILSRPVIIAANNEQAQILVGSQRPFVQVSRSLPTDAASRDQVVQYKDVGTKLIVRPTISPDGYVVLEVSQEVNSATTEVAFNAPVISTRSVQTQLLIKDRQTVALGGLVDHERDSNRGGIPFLSSIPLIGGLFGHVSRRTSDTELYLFLTPYVMRTDQEADSITAPLRTRFDRDTL